jgi:hypothetical protein
METEQPKILTATTTLRTEHNMKAVSSGDAKKHCENLHRQTQERPASSHKKEQDKYPDKRHFTAEDIYRRKATKTHETSSLLAKKVRAHVKQISLENESVQFSR